jgi:AraC family ethanolamine operon transcriptional activator
MDSGMNTPHALVERPLRYLARTSADVDEHASHLSRWHQEYDQLSGGRFQGQVREVWMEAPRLQIFHEHTVQPTSQQCMPWQGSVWFGIPDAYTPDALHFCGQKQGHEQAQAILVARASDGFSLRTPHNFGIYGVVVDAGWLQAAIGTAEYMPSLQATPISLAHHAAVCTSIETILQCGVHAEADTADHQALPGLVLNLLKLLCTPAQHLAQPPRPHTHQRRFATVLAARAMVSQPMHQTITVDDVCARLHLTRRTLQNHFQSVVGLSPADFLKAVRLNACRRQLRAASAHELSVQDVAAQWGFFHMGHFAHDYKQMFGEPPSQTLRSAQWLH